MEAAEWDSRVCAGEAATVASQDHAQHELPGLTEQPTICTRHTQPTRQVSTNLPGVHLTVIALPF